MIKITSKEWKFIAIAGAIFIFLTFLPIIIGKITSPAGSVFLGGQIVNLHDLPVYYSNIEQVKNGHYLFKNLFTSEAHPYFIFDPFWLAVGLFAKIFSLSAFLAFQLSRFLLIPILFIVSYYLIAFFFEEEIKRKICFLLLIFGSGLGWLYGFTTTGSWEVPLDLQAVDAFFFPSCHNSPHFIASLILIGLIFLLSLLVFENSTTPAKKRIYSLGAGFCVLFLSFFHPYHLITIFAVLLVFIIIYTFKNRKINFGYLKHYFILLLFGLPAVFYHFWTLQNLWVRYQHLLQNIILTPSFSMILISYGFLIILALIGCRSLIIQKQKNQKDIFLLSWFGIQFSLIYFPFTFQRRLVEGLEIPMAILATFGLFFLRDYLKEKMFFRALFFPQNNLLFKIFLIYLFIFSFFLSNLTIIANDLALYIKNSPRIYIKNEEQEATLWLRNNTPEESVILSLYENGNLIPAISLRQVYLGHPHQTAQWQEKTEKVSRFFSEENDDNWKISFLKEEKINYFYFAEEEKNRGLFNPDEKEYLKKVYANNYVTIYKVEI